MMEKEKKSNVFKIVFRVFTCVVVAFAVVMTIFTVISVTTVDKNNRSIFGYKFFIDLTDSMSPDYFSAGDIVIVKNTTDFSTIHEGDVITYQSLMDGETYGKPITHKVRSVTQKANGTYEFVTYGTATNTDDALTVTQDYVLGKYVGKIANLGYFFQYLQSPIGYILCVLIPFLLLIGAQGVNCVHIFKKYKREQLEAVESEKSQLEAEREENKKMMQELLALKEQLTKQQEEKKEDK